MRRHSTIDTLIHSQRFEKSSGRMMIVLPFAVKVSRTYLPEAPDTGFIVRYP